MKRFIGVMIAMVMGFCSVGVMNVWAEGNDENSYLIAKQNFQVSRSGGSTRITLSIYSNGTVDIITNGGTSITGVGTYNIKSLYTYKIKFNSNYNYTGDAGEFFFVEYNNGYQIISEGRGNYSTDHLVEYVPISTPASEIYFEVGNELYRYTIPKNQNPTYGDFNSDGEVNASDAALILIYAAAHGAGSFNGTFEEYIAQN